MEDITAAIESSDHDRVIKPIVDYLVMNLEEKRNSVYIHGPANTGKTQFLNRMNKIFDCVNFYDSTGRFSSKYPHKKVKPSFITLEEGAHKTLWNSPDSMMQLNDSVRDKDWC